MDKTPQSELRLSDLSTLTTSTTNYVSFLFLFNLLSFSTHKMGSGGGGLVVSMLAFYSDDLSSIPVEVYNFSVKMLLKRTKINKKRPELVEY